MEFCVLSGRGLCHVLITRPEEALAHGGGGPVAPPKKKMFRNRVESAECLKMQ